jgi:para-aminobenzoate synthetase/4-amino-4-deoxychorismate lyase
MDEVANVLRAAEQRAAAGAWCVGYLRYEAAPAFDPAFAVHPAEGPLAWFGVFERADPWPEPPPINTGIPSADWSTALDRATFDARIARVHDAIRAGETYQINLTAPWHRRFEGNVEAWFRALQRAQPLGYAAFIDTGEEQFLSVSPELFFDWRDGTIVARPMKGTTARAPQAEADARQAAAMVASEKERAENLMIVDLIRNDLGRIAETGSVAVSDLFAVETYPTLHTMVSTVTAKKRPGAGPADIIAALFPCGSVTGAPKIRAMEILRELEASPRGAYCGAIGHFAPDGSARFNVAIRTLTITGHRGELGIGGGVVQDSDAAGEYAECLLKARFFEAARRPLELIETLRFDNGIVRRDAHLARMERSASVFGLAFDDTAASAALETAVSGKGGPQRVRLTLDESGNHRATAAPLPPNPDRWTYALSPIRVQSGDVLQQHKTIWRELYDSEAARLGTDEAIFLNERGEVAEGARSNVFVKRGDIFLTPPLTAGALPGILRGELLARGEAREAILMPDDLIGEFFFGNSLRGLIPAMKRNSI